MSEPGLILVEAGDVTIARKEVFHDFTSGISGPTEGDYKIAEVLNRRLMSRVVVPPERASDTGWLIELGSNPPEYWIGQSGDSFRPDANAAVRFARFADADLVRRYMIQKDISRGCKAVEHAWTLRLKGESE